MQDPVFRATLAWHKAGLITSPRAGSVQMTQALVEEIALARELIRVISSAGIDRVRVMSEDEYDAWAMRAADFRLRTNGVDELVRRG